ncbi:hypothetical protein E4N62_18585 [Streptomyces sp. MNU76]|uniref:hypothetical protein n=1 Tax=Streptomyces sp. MNU76 TaxID=2560026 RepID=UPI001E4FE61E|nr:hypothetical protein [Streptomyces sp. MNU76]MCC9707100.1 hypothetical protein [Streptomyces sp. MNU76]
MPDSDSALHVTIARDRKTGHVTARGGDHFASALLQHSAGFLPVGQRRDSSPYAPLPAYHRLPAGLTDWREQQHQASLAAAVLARIAYRPGLAPDLDAPVTDDPFREPLSWTFSDLGTRIDRCEHTSDVARLLREFTEPADGILPHTVQVLHSASRWWQGLGGDADHRRADRLERIAKTLASHTRTAHDLANRLEARNAHHPYRSPVPGPHSSLPELRTTSVPPTLRTPVVSALADVNNQIEQAPHTRDVAWLLADITVPQLGVLDSAVANLQTAASWWQGLGTLPDHGYSDQLGDLATDLGAYARELNKLRGHLADRHLAHPHRGARATTGSERARAASAPSPGRQRVAEPSANVLAVSAPPTSAPTQPRGR